MNLGKRIAGFISRLVDLFYFPIFRSLIDQKSFRYAAVGGTNLGFGVVLYWFLFNIVLQKQDTTFFGLVTISAPILAFLINFVITFFTGFWLTKNVAFSGSALRGRVQLIRYTMVVGLNIMINYWGLKLLVEVFEFYPTPSYLSLQVITVSISYLSSRYFIFR